MTSSRLPLLLVAALASAGLQAQTYAQPQIPDSWGWGRAQGAQAQPAQDPQAQAPAPAPASGAKGAYPVGVFDAAGVRIGMEAKVAFEAMALTKPEWAPTIATQKPERDCASQGVGMFNILSRDGLLSSQIQVRCYTVDGKALVGEVGVMTRLDKTFPIPEAKAALLGRYGEPSANSGDAAGGFVLEWSGAGAQRSPIRGEKLVAELRAPAFETSAAFAPPFTLSLRLIGDLSAQPASSGQLRALPF